MAIDNIQRKKVLFLITHPIYPITGGREVVLYNYCKGIKEMFDQEIDLILLEKENFNRKKVDFIDNQYFIKTPDKIEKLKNLLVNSLILRKWPLQVSVYYSKKAFVNFQEKVEVLNPDVIICDMARTAEYLTRLKNVQSKLILDMDDLISKRYLRQLKNLDETNIFGQYKKNIPNSLVKLLKNKKIKKYILKKEYKLLKKYEEKISKKFEKIVFVSPKETKEFNQQMQFDKSVCVTIGVDYEYYSKKVIEKIQNDTICFLGNMNVPHNQAAVEYFIEKLFIKIKKEVPNCKFKIVGKCNEEYKKKFEDREDIIVTGQVEDIREYVQNSKVSVAPLIYGTGIKTKILETMAMGVPIVTNSIGAEGIDIDNGVNIFVCDNNDEFIKKVIDLLQDESLNKKIAYNAQNLINEKYQWNKTLKNMEKFLTGKEEE